MWAQSSSHVWLIATPWTIARQAPLSLGFSRQEYWSELPFPSPGDLPDPGIKPGSSALAGGFFTTEPVTCMCIHIWLDTYKCTYTYICVYIWHKHMFICVHIYVWQMIKLCYFLWFFRSKSLSAVLDKCLYWAFSFYGSKYCTPCGGDLGFLQTCCMDPLCSWQLWPSFLSWTSSFALICLVELSTRPTSSPLAEGLGPSARPDKLN